MKVIDCAVIGKELQVKSLDDFLAAFKIKRSWSVDTEAQEIILAAFQRVLDNKFTMLRNVAVDGSPNTIPLILIGLSGVWVLYPSALRGVYRARGDAWEKMDSRQQTYKPSGDNLLTRTERMADAVRAYLAGHGVRDAQVGSALLFTNPGIHVEIVRPVVRVVLIDALDRFITGILQGRLLYDREEVENIVNLFTNPPAKTQKPPEEAEPKPVDSRPDELSDLKKASLERLERIDSTFSKVEKLPFSSRQWLLLGLLIFVNVIILVAFVLFILLTS